MSDQEVDLNALIQNDRKRKHIQKNHHRDRDEKGHQRGDRDHRNHRDNRDHHRDRSDKHREDRYERRPKHQKQFVPETYALSVTGFVSDVSLDDILKMAKGYKIINIKASLTRQDGEPLNPDVDTDMKVLINFEQKNDADDFIKKYSDKQLDGKNTLQFQFRRGIPIRKKKLSDIKKKQEVQEQNPADADEE